MSYQHEQERFWSKVDRSGDCWTWTAGRLPKGYGRFHHNGKLRLAHRVAYEMVVGPIPDGLQLDHLCRNPACVNPVHLEPVTARENTVRGNAPAASRARTKTHCPAGHEYSGDNLFVSTRKSGYLHRLCRACHREKQRARRAQARRAS